MPKQLHDQQLRIRMTKAEVGMLADIADYVGLTRSDIVRQLIRARHAELFGAPKPKTRRRRA